MDSDVVFIATWFINLYYKKVASLRGRWWLHFSILHDLNEQEDNKNRFYGNPIVELVNIIFTQLCNANSCCI